MEELPDTNRTTISAGPGEILLETRRKLGIEPENVAQILHLSTHQIEAIEANDYSNLPEPTYVRGYLRSYCQLLNIAPENVLKSYNDAIGGWKTTTYSGLAAEHQASSKDNIVRLATMGVIGVVFGLAIVWWLGEDEPPQSAPAPTELAAVATEEGGEVNTEIRSAELAAIEELPQSVVPVQPAPVAKVEAVQADQPIVKVEPAKAREASPVPSGKLPDAEKTGVEPAVKIPAARPGTSSASGVRAKLVLRTTGTSWADIRDANDNKLLYESITSNRIVALEGQAPLQVFLGNAGVVTLELNGAAYDFSRHQRGLTARFSIGAIASTGTGQ